MTRAALHRECIAPAIGQGRPRRRFRVERFTQLVEDREGEIGAMTCDAAIGLDRSRENAEQGRFARAVAANEANAIAAQYAGRKIARNNLITKPLVDVLELGNETAAGIRG